MANDTPNTAMTAPRARTPDEAEALLDQKLPDPIRRALTLRKQLALTAVKLGGLGWGKDYDYETRKAVADFARKFKLDATTELYVLGGQIYINARYYLRRLAELVDAGVVEYAYIDHVADDARLEEFPEERQRRAEERLKAGVPAKDDHADAVAVAHVKLRHMDREITAAKWCGGTTRRDPVGNEFPTETAETRAMRRAMRLLVSHVNDGALDDVTIIEAEAELLSEEVVAPARAAHKAAVAAHAGPRALTSGQTPDIPVASREAALAEAERALQSNADPYTGDKVL